MPPSRCSTPRRTSLVVSRRVAEEARDAAYFERMTVAELVETAIRRWVGTLTEERGEPYPRRPSAAAARRRRRKATS